MAARTDGGILTGAAITFLGAAVGGLLLFVNEVLVARLLGLDAYGLFALAVTAAKICEKFAVFGLHVTVLHFIPIERERGDFALARGTALGAVSIAALVGGAMTCALQVAAPWIADAWFRHAELAPVLRISVLAVPLLAAGEILGNVARACGYPAYYVLARNLAPQVTLCLLLLAALAAHGGVHFAAWGFVGAALVSALLAGGLAWRGAGPEMRAARSRLRLAERLRYALPVLANSLLYALLGWTDILVLGAWASAADVAIYRACTQVVIVFDLLSIAFNAASANHFALSAHRGDDQHLRATYALALRWQVMLALGALLVVTANAHAILGLLGPAFVGGASPLLILAFATAVHCCFGTAGFLMVMTGRQALETRNAVIATSCNLLGNLLLVPRYGIVGAALATGTALLVMNALRLVQVRAILHGLTVDRRTSAMLAVTLLGVLALRGAWPEDGTSAVVAARGVLSILLALGMMFSLGLERDERHRLLAALRRRSP